MAFICFYLKVHQPLRVKRYSVFHIGNDPDYFSGSCGREGTENSTILQKVAQKSYLPTNELLKELIKKNPNFKLALSLSGIFLEQAEKLLPQVLDSFKELVGTGNVELLGETYYHSLSFLYSEEEFEQQVRMQEEILKRTFGFRPRAFSNTEAAFSDDLGRLIRKFGYDIVLTEGADKVLGWRSPNFLYNSPGADLKLLLKNYKLSDDIAFRFSERSWNQWPLTAEKFASWVSSLSASSHVINIFMDYETFGEHQWKETGIFDFLAELPSQILKDTNNIFMTPSEIADSLPPVAELSIPEIITWADTDRDLSAWLGNDMQRDAFKKLYSLAAKVKETGDQELVDTWRKLQTSDHFYYMCTKWFSDGDVHKYFNPYDSPYEAFTSFMNVLKDLEFRINK